MIKATKKWLLIRISSALLIPFMIWFLINFVSLFDANHSQLLNFLSSNSTKVVFSIFLFLAFTFYSLTLSEVFEDYISDFKLKNAANRFLVLFSIVSTLLLVILLLRI